MAATVLEFVRGKEGHEVGALPIGRVRMYAIAFDLDTAQLQQEDPNAPWQNAYNNIRKTLIPLGFIWQQGSVYFGDQTINAVRCLLAAQALRRIRGLRPVCAISECCGLKR
jgi:virulence-associated protein VapD